MQCSIASKLTKCMGINMKKQELKKRRNRFPPILFALMFLIGLTVMAYPFLSDWYNQRIQDKLITEYDNTVTKVDKKALEAEKKASKEYNESLLQDVALRNPSGSEEVMGITTDYEERLNLADNGIMGYIEIPKIDVNLVIFHGTSVEVLEKSVGHLENTSLPVGGLGTHAALTAHTSHVKAVLFNDLIDLEERDQFILTVLDKKLAYEVDQIKIVEPSDISDLYIDLEEDYVTLVTCTPYGINTQRLLVRGTRIPYVEEEVDKQTQRKTNFLCLMILVMVLVVLVVIFFIRRRRIHHKADY